MPGIGRRFHGEMLNWMFGKGSPATPAGVIYVGLSTADAGVDGQSNAEPSGGSYARVAMAAVDWNAATLADPAVSDNLNVVAFIKATADWVGGSNLTHFTLWNHLTNTAEANYLGCGLLDAAKPVFTDDTASFPAGDVNTQLDYQ